MCVSYRDIRVALSARIQFRKAVYSAAGFIRVFACITPQDIGIYRRGKFIIGCRIEKYIPKSRGCTEPLAVISKQLPHKKHISGILVPSIREQQILLVFF